ncbi:SecDF P1 head subdomain-containing protein [Kerstersia similis]|uniref:SecDF P1 head subdomain-containing protein n=1 Tax=Kerstersia similis TaxID=206505 RepID=UPI0039F0CF3D
MKTIFSKPVLVRGMAVLSLALLAACQQTAPVRQDSQPTAADQAAARQQAAAQAAAQPAAQAPAASTAPTVSFFLAQAQPAEGLAEVALNPTTRLYALPQPVLTQQDLQQVVPVRNAQGQVFLRFDFNEQGAQKLATVTSRAQGNYLILSMRDQIVAVPQITATYDQGFLPVPVQSAEAAQSILQLLRPAPAQQ